MKIKITKANIRPTMSIANIRTEVSTDYDGNVLKSRAEEVINFDEPKMVGDFEFVVSEHPMLSNNDICDVICGEAIVRCHAMTSGDGSFTLRSVTASEVLNGEFRLPEHIDIVSRMYLEV